MILAWQKHRPTRVAKFCIPDPSQRPLSDFDYGTDRRYKANDNLPAVIMATVFAGAGIAFIVGASTGGAEWSSRSMTLQLLWEPRRMRLLTIKWLGLLTAVMALAVVAVLLALGLGAITASLRGTWGGHLDPALGTSLGQCSSDGTSWVGLHSTGGDRRLRRRHFGSQYRRRIGNGFRLLRSRRTRHRTGLPAVWVGAIPVELQFAWIHAAGRVTGCAGPQRGIPGG